ncbi:MAG: purine phosphorylase [Deltaproteobacteria bacterium]|nr:purine phosphorylase [Deltaproteobacteria bacterium]
MSEARSLTMVPIGADGLARLEGTTLLKVAGIGAKRALAASEFLIAEGAAALLSWGSGGALHPKLSPGNLILPKSVIVSQNHVFPTDTDWHNRLVARLKDRLEIHSEPLAQSPSVLASPLEKFTFSNQNDAIAVDMESGSVAEMASRANLPFMAIRAIADTADMAIPASGLNAIDEYGRLRPMRLLNSLARKPADLVPLVRLSRSFRAARTTLEKVVRLAGNDLLAF